MAAKYLYSACRAWWGTRTWTSAACVLSALTFAAGSIYCGTAAAPWLAVTAALILVTAVERSRAVTGDLFLWGIAFHLSAFYWLPNTLTFFGGFPIWISELLFLLFAAVSSIQLLLCAWLYKRFLRKLTASSWLAWPLAWSICEFIVPRLFPWSFVHPLLRWTHFSILASYFGEAPLAFFLFWACETLVRLRPQLPGRQKLALTFFALSLVSLECLSIRRERQLMLALETAPKVRVALVQGNLSATQKGDIRELSANLDRYRTLSKAAEERGAELLIWPESVMNAWTKELATNVRGTKYDPFPENSVPLLYGGLSFRPRTPAEIEQLGSALGSRMSEELKYRKFNTAFGIDTRGTVLGRYHKRVLMPFGEYLPFSEMFPSIKSLSPYSGDFSSGDLVEPIVFPLRDTTYNVGTLICYEDVVPGLARAAAQKGADLLVNLTNDAWYGETAAPYQHHLLASWRAIESGRFLLRSTNTGVTAIVDPLGRTTAILPIFQEGVIEQEVGLMKDSTFYVKYGDAMAWLLCAVGLTLLTVKPRR